MIHEYLDGRVVCAKCAGIMSNDILESHHQSEHLPETNCEHVRAARQARWDAMLREARQAGEDLTMKMILCAANAGACPDLELIPGPPPEWMVS